MKKYPPGDFCWTELATSHGNAAKIDTDGTTKKAKSSGARIHVEPTDIPNVGRFAAMSDPQGAMFSVIKLLHSSS